MRKLRSDVKAIKVSKSNALIELNDLGTKYKLSLNEQKIILSVVGQISPEDDDFEDYTIPVSDLKKITGIKDNNFYGSLETICSRLVTSEIKIRRKSGRGFLLTTWFAHAEHIPEKGVVEFSFSPKLRPYLLKLKREFTTYHLGQVINLPSTYSIRIYELLMQFLSTGYRETTLADLRAFLGIRENQYKVFKDFRRQILEKAQADLKENTDISFTFNTKRIGRKVGIICFSIKQNEKSAKAKKVSKARVKTNEAFSGREKIAMEIRDAIGKIADRTIVSLLNLYDDDLVIREAIFDLNAIAESEGIKTTKLQCFKYLLKKNADDRVVRAEISNRKIADSLPRKRRTTKEQLMDTSWADDDWLEQLEEGKKNSESGV